jgi:hypothetical protein
MRLSGNPPGAFPEASCLECLQHPVLIELTIAKIGFGVDLDFQLPSLLGSRRVDSRGSQPTQMFIPLLGIHDMNGLVPALKSLLNEWKQHAIFFVVIREQRTDMANCAKLGAG